MEVPSPVEDVKIVSSILYFCAQIKCILYIIIMIIIIMIIIKNPPLSKFSLAEKCLHPALDCQRIESRVW